MCARVHAVAARIKSADSDSALTIESTAKHVTITQVQTTSKRTPTRAKKDQAGAVNLQINIGGRSTAPLKMQKQTVQTKISHNDRKSSRKKDASDTLATNAQQEVMSPEALSLKEEDGGDAPCRPPRPERGIRPPLLRRTRPRPAPRLGAMKDEKKKKQKERLDRWRKVNKEEANL